MARVCCRADGRGIRAAAGRPAAFPQPGAERVAGLRAPARRGGIGPSPDATTLDAARIEARVDSGRGPMPAFGDRLEDEKIADVTEG
jgi:mono/diheme cytochrome c family protein